MNTARDFSYFREFGISSQILGASEVEESLTNIKGDALRDWVPFVQFKKREKLYKWYQIAQNITYIDFFHFLCSIDVFLIITRFSNELENATI